MNNNKIMVPDCYGEGPDEDDCPVSCVFYEECDEESHAKEEDEFEDLNKELLEDSGLRSKTGIASKGGSR